MIRDIATLLNGPTPVVGDGGYLMELERRGYVDSGSSREKVGTGRGSGQFTPEVVIENPSALIEMHREFLGAGAQVLQALTFFGSREKLNRRGMGPEQRTSIATPSKLHVKLQVRKPLSRAQYHARSFSNGKGLRPRDTFEICCWNRSDC